MSKQIKTKQAVALLFTGLLAACGGQTDGEEGTQPTNTGAPAQELLLPGKADNFYSNVAAEFEMSGRIFVELTGEEERGARDEAIQQRLTAVGLFLTAFLTDKFEGIDINDDGMIGEDEVFFRNVDYGGFKAMVRNGSLEEENIEEVEGGVMVDFTIDVAGPVSLNDLLLESGGELNERGLVVFDLFMPEGATSDPENVARREIRNFDPEKYSGEVETIALTVTPLPEISDAYPHYKEFMEDGVYDITMFFGHDYNMPRADLEESKETFEHLVRRGFEAPVGSWDELGADSGPFTKVINFGGEQILIEVRLFHGDMYIDNRGEHKQKAIDELIARDVFFYNGHAGPYFGLYLDANHEADVGYLEIAELDLPAKQQLFIAQGCQTYSQYADMLYANPNKSEDNLDAITTINYSYGIGTLELFDDLTRTDVSDEFLPVTFYDIVAGLNRHYWNSAKEVFYGVMGIDGNDQIHPTANMEMLGEGCRSTADCGSEQGNICVNTGRDVTCAVRTLAESACPTDTNVGQVELREGAFLVCYK
jgi:hypothetical protein